MDMTKILTFPEHVRLVWCHTLADMHSRVSGGRTRDIVEVEAQMVDFMQSFYPLLEDYIPGQSVEGEKYECLLI